MCHTTWVYSACTQECTHWACSSEHTKLKISFYQSVLRARKEYTQLSILKRAHKIKNSKKIECTQSTSRVYSVEYTQESTLILTNEYTQ